MNTDQKTNDTVTSPQGYTTSDGRFFSYGDMIATAKKKRASLEKENQPVEPWVMELSNLTADDTDRLDSIIAEHGVSQPSDETETSVKVMEKDTTEEDPAYPVTYYNKGFKNWGSGSLWFGLVYSVFTAAFLGVAYFVIFVLSETLKLDLTFSLVGSVLFGFTAWLGVLSLITGTLGLFASRYNGYGIGKSLAGILITLAMTAGAIAFLVLV